MAATTASAPAVHAYPIVERLGIRSGAVQWAALLAQLPGCHQQRIWGVMTVPLTRFSVASHEVHWRT
jgi:hypothetical protein